MAAGRFVPPFKRDRMTWIKPSFLWMMYRCDWATKPGQERVLAVKITRAGFEWALAHACLSHFVPHSTASIKPGLSSSRSVRSGSSGIRSDPCNYSRCRTDPCR
jgi:Domain of unknown function (DUF4291)